MIQIINVWRWLVWGGTVSLLLACGGGGGGGNDGGSGGGNSASSVSSGNSSSSGSSQPGIGQTLPPVLSGRPGEYGELDVRVSGNRTAVEISYRPAGGGLVEQFSVGPDQSESLRLPAGIAPDMSLVSVPVGQHCDLSVDWQFQVMPRTEVISVNCIDRFTLPDSIDAYPLQWVVLPGVALADIKADLRVALTQGDDSTDIAFVVEDGALLFMMPDLEAGTGQVQLWQGDTSLAQLPVTIASLPTLDTATFLDGWFAEQFVGVEAALSGDELVSWQTRYAEDSVELRLMFAELSADDKALVVRYLWANLSAVNALLDSPAPIARGGAFQLQKSSLLSCSLAVIRMASFTAAVGYLGVGTVAVGAAVTGPAAPVAAVASGLLVSALAIKSSEKIRVLAKDTVKKCAKYRGQAGAVEQADADNPPVSMAKGRLQKSSGADVVITRTLHLTHEQPYQTATRVQRVLPSDLVSSLRSLQGTLQPISGLVGDQLDWLYLFDFDERIPLSQVTSLQVTGARIVANTLALSDLSILSIELAFTGTTLPDQPEPFLITGNATAYDAWLAEEVPIDLEMTGHLSGKPPVAFDVMFNIKPNEVFKFTLPIEFATSTAVVVTPRHGRVLPGADLSEYYYFPDEGNEAEDSFEYEARNGLGTARGTVTFVAQNDCTYEDLSWGRVWLCRYEFHTYERSLTVTVEMKDGFSVENGQCSEVSRSVNAFYYETTNGSIPEEDAVADITGDIRYQHCDDSIRHYAYHNTGYKGTSKNLSIIRKHSGELKSARFYTLSHGFYNQLEGQFYNDRSCEVIGGFPSSSTENNFAWPGSFTPVYSNVSRSKSLVYCPRTQPSDLVPFPPNFTVDSASAFRYAIQLLEREGVQVK